MNEYGNYFEYRVIKKHEGKYRLQKYLMILAYILLPFIIICLSGIISIKGVNFIAVSVIVLIPLYPLLLKTLIIPFTYPYVNIEYEYRIKANIMEISLLYGKRKRRVMAEIKISEAQAINPYSGEYKALADSPEIARRCCAVSSMSDSDIYYIIFTGPDGVKTAVFFNAVNKALRLLGSYNRSTVIKEVKV